MNKRTLTYASFLALVVLLSACGPTATRTQTPEPKPSPMTIPAATRTQTPEPTPSPMNIGELISELEFRGQLIHFTEDQWKLTLDQLTLDQLDPLETLPDVATRMFVAELPDGGGFLGKMIPKECPPGDCDPVRIRGEAYSGLYEPGSLPDPDTWFKEMCYCVEPKEEGLDLGPVEPPPGIGPCEFQFVPVTISLAGQVRTIMLFQCVAVEGRCSRCQLGFSTLESGTVIGCQCPLLPE